MSEEEKIEDQSPEDRPQSTENEIVSEPSTITQIAIGKTADAFNLL